MAAKRILIYRVGSLGDTIIALPVFHKVCEAFPGADITLLTNQPIMAKAAALETVLGSDGYFFHRVLNYPSGTNNPKVLLALIRQIRALKIDIIINLATVRIQDTLKATKRGNLRDHLFFRLAGITTHIGFPKIKEDFILCIDPETGDLEWEAKRLARRLEVLGKIDLNDNANWDMRFNPIELDAANQATASLVAGQPIIAVSAGTKVQANDWEEYNWQALILQLKNILQGWQLVIIGAPDEYDRADRCLEAWGGAGINLCGRTSPRVSGAVLQKAAIFIGHDSGPMHLAAAVGTPCVAIYSARNLPRRWFPRGDFNKIIYHRTDCASCRLDVCIEQKKKCILSISVDEVREAVISILKRDNLLKK